ncbi:hypothetical protein AVEN_77062-1 [Araneus ventricosus]|uniref:ribonuclease H n=1 Tax=Araneus ventricosus TaxID=182803 RepID=A0A4Y2G911_ARAVE|nr:hypothetical protein AVEN_77062-1 [Araneus ventricosus]
MVFVYHWPNGLKRHMVEDHHSEDSKFYPKSVNQYYSKTDGRCAVATNCSTLSSCWKFSWFFLPVQYNYAVKVYTDGSRNDSNCTGSGNYIKRHNQELKIQRRNPDFCSVFRSELIAIDEGLDLLSSFSCSNEIWILTDSRSSIQHLANWHRIRDNTGMNILNRLKSLSVSYRIHLQWIPSHVNIHGNEIADALAKAGADDASVPSAPLTYLELFSRAKRRNKTIWLIPPEHHWYQGS